MNEKTSKLLDRSLFDFYKDALRIAMFHPAWWPAAARLFFNQIISSRKRRAMLRQNVNVPPFLIISVTDKCNLKCAGCYARNLHAGNREQFSTQRLHDVLAEAQVLGVSTVLIAGGEPLTRPDILEVTAGYGNIAFALFTNGTLIDDGTIDVLKRQKNVIPVLSMEGLVTETDARRGEGVFLRIESAMVKLTSSGIFFGCSVTVTRDNLHIATDPAWVDALMKKGCRLFFFVEYIPVEPGSGHKVLTDSERRKLIESASLFRKKHALFIAFPGDEEQFGGCLAAGRGFIHINSSGDVEPCPFAPYSDSSIIHTSLKEVLSSGLLAKIRDNHEALNETSGGCALWKEREWVESLLK
ncbi:MAG TPA: radical SAM protein [Fibrobacteres bacterium]|jgi:MoaA/NifB/PqqE/SkfB family radical SAM enzyme|nr:radical SAM protein [Fibrobacterota bacterium]